MKSMIIISCLICFSQFRAQLRCTERIIQNETVKTCLHKNGSISTTESWDSDKRWGSFKAYDPQGMEIINYGLRKVGGHASVYVDYFPNGQIKKLEFSSAPDGGIQSYRYIHFFDETGKQTEYHDYSMPDGHPTLFTTPVVIQEIKPQVPETKSTNKNTIFTVINASSAKVQILFQDSLTSIKSRRKLTLFTSENQENYVNPSLFAPKLVFTRKTKKHLKLLAPEVKEENNTRFYTWYVVEE